MESQLFVSWNVNGIRAIIKKGFPEIIRELNPAILCLQETKAAEDEALETLGSLKGYHVFVNSSKARKGYSGTALLSREMPVNVTYDIGYEEFDQEGRVIAAEYDTHFVVTVYTPNAGEGLSRLDYRERWDQEFGAYVAWLRKRKPVIVCGDLNVAHQALDLAHPKENYNKSAGYTQKEIDGFSRLLAGGLVDSFRHFYPHEAKYTYWNYYTFGRDKNVGWRIDHFLVDTRVMPAVKDAFIYNEYHGSDHCPVGLRLEF